MTTMSIAPRYDETVTLPRAVRFPVEMIPPDGFDATRRETWPVVTGRLEYVDGRLLYMPPCGDEQQDTVTDVVITLGAWIRAHPDYVLGTNEAGMLLRGSTRAADAAIWKRSEIGSYSGRVRRVPPILAVEVAGDASSDTETALRDKARWYLDASVRVVWIVVPETRSVIVITQQGTAAVAAGDKLPRIAELPGLEPVATDLFVQIDQHR